MEVEYIKNGIKLARFFPPANKLIKLGNMISTLPRAIEHLISVPMQIVRISQVITSIYLSEWPYTILTNVLPLKQRAFKNQN